MNVARDFYLKQLVDSMWDGQVKVITGLRRCGKSYLLKNLFGEYLRKNGVTEDQIILLELDLLSHAVYRNPIKLVEFVREKVSDDGVPTILINKAAKDFRVGKMEQGEGLTTYFAKTNAAGEVTEVSSAPATRTVGDIFTSRVGMRYVPGDGEVLGKGSMRGTTARAPSPHGGGATARARPVSLRSAVSPHGGGTTARAPSPPWP